MNFSTIFNAIHRFAAKVQSIFADAWNQTVDPELSEAIDTVIEQAVDLTASVARLAKKAILSTLALIGYVDNLLDERFGSKLRHLILAALAYALATTILPTLWSLFVLGATFAAISLVFLLAIGYHILQIYGTLVIILVAAVSLYALFTETDETINYNDAVFNEQV